jgi:hypothetical protein
MNGALRWALVYGKDLCKHIIPLDDTHAHTTRGEKCVCKPELSELGNIVHNSFDGREQYENGRRQRH